MIASLLLLAAAVTAATPPATDAPPDDPILAAVQAQDDALQAAHGRGDLATYLAGLSKHYVYIDIGGKRVTADMMVERREGDRRRVVSSEALEHEAVRLSDTSVMVRGRDRSLATYYGGLPRHGDSRWTALWIREDDGVWRLAAETATPIRDHEGLAFDPAPQPRSVLDALAGRWTLATTPPLVLDLRASDDGLVGRLDGETVEWTFRPASPTHYYAGERPFELRFAVDGESMEMVTWGTATKAVRSGK